MRRFAVLALVLLGLHAGAAAQTPDAETISVTEPANAVTVYRGRASVTRTFERDFEPGRYDLRFVGLPQTVSRATIQARAFGPAKVLTLDTVQRAAREAVSEKLAALDERIEAARDGLRMLAEDRGLLDREEDFVNAVTVRATADATEQAGTPALDLAVVREQLSFVATEHKRLLEERRVLAARERELAETLRILEAERAAMAGHSDIERTAVVAIAVTEASRVRVDLSYLVSEAGWQPTYSVRAAANGSSVLVEYDALISQRTGEDWEAVTLTLSTAEPNLAANPPALPPWYVNEIEPGSDSGRGGGGMGGGFAADKSAITLGAALKPMDPPAESVVAGAGPSVTYRLTRPATIMTGSVRQQRTRIANIDTDPEFVHVALPLLTEAVYIRGDLTNNSAYQLLPGPVAIFVGPDYVGPTRLPSVAPGGDFELFFGIDRSVSATRVMVERKTSKTGLLGGGRKTSSDYRIEVDNGAGKTVFLELWDRIPVSRSEKVKIDLLDVSRPLAAGADYLEGERRQGLLKWVLGVPPNVSGGPTYAITYSVRVTRPKDIETTPLPE